MQTITDDLASIITSELQAGPSGFRGRVEVGAPSPTFPTVTESGGTSASASTHTLTLPTYAPGDLLIVHATGNVSNTDIGMVWTFGGSTVAFTVLGSEVGASWYAARYRVMQAGDSDTSIAVALSGAAALAWAVHRVPAGSFDPATAPEAASHDWSYGTSPDPPNLVPSWGSEDTLFLAISTRQVGGPMTSVPASYTSLGAYIGGPAIGTAYRWLAAASDDPGVFVWVGVTFWTAATVAVRPSLIVPVVLKPKRIDIDQSLNLGAGQMVAEIPNEDLALGWAGSSVFPTNSRIRAYQWYGDATNEVRTFTGVIDRVGDSRDPLNVVLACRDMMAILIDQTHTAIGPQGAGETGAVRTEANGVYLNREVDYIANDFLDRAGWPAADRAITPTSYTLAEFIIADGESYAAAIIGADRLTGLTGYDFWADEMGVAHFAPSVSASALTEAAVPAYTFRTGVDVISLSDETTQYDLRTRVKVRGPLTTTTLTDTWRELWRTSKIKYPVGIWYDPAVPANIRVLDRGTKRLYKLRQSDRVVLSSTYLGAVISYPIGISGDPADAATYWVLNAPWAYGGATSGNSIKKVRKSDNHVLASYSIANGRWTAIKVSAAYIWLTNWDTDHIHKHDKSDGSSIASYGHAGQTNPAGLMIDGTTLHVFWTNGGTTARFYVCSESAPTVVTKVVKTAGTTLHGGEMNTTDHVTCWGDSDSLHLVAKFTLIDVTAVTTEVFAEVMDSDLEDELGALAQTEPRVHDTHPGDAAHPWMIRRDTVTLDTVISLAQATDTAGRRLDKLAHRSRVLDFGILGNPAIQKSDLVRVEDPFTGIGENFLIDTHRSGMAAEGTYVGTIAGIPVVSPGDVVTDDGDAT